ncbi:MAG TPA: VOC family protein [Verrucomicrobiae bacterium]|nr:VOC family protein [Verrucomicrobiae bacterium]
MAVAMKNVVVFVMDLQKARRFYLELLKLPLKGETPSMMEFFTGQPTLGVVLAMHDDARKLVGRHTGITLAVTGIDRVCADLTLAGVSFPEPLEATPWGKMAVLQDPDGNQFALVEG